VIVAAAVLLCGGTVVTGVLLAQRFTNPKNSGSSLVSGAQPTPASASRGPATEGSSYTSGSVVYEVTGDGRVNITYLEESGIWTTTKTNVRLPWRIELHPDRLTVLSLVAIRPGNGNSSSKVTCRALVNGREIVKNSGQGRYGAASCYSYSVGG
jgi:hypothetical protein